MTTITNKNSWVDPVCHMEVNPASKVSPFVFKKSTYHFCAEACRKAFVAHPQKYLETPTPKPKGWWGRYLDRLNKITGGKPPCCH